MPARSPSVTGTAALENIVVVRQMTVFPLCGFIRTLPQVMNANEIQEICSGFYRTAAPLYAQEKSNLLPGPTSCVSRHGEII